MGHLDPRKTGPIQQGEKPAADQRVSAVPPLESNEALDGSSREFAVRMEIGGTVVAFDDGDRSAGPEDSLQLPQGAQGIGQMFEHKADEDRVERGVGKPKPEYVGLLEAHVGQALPVDRRPGLFQRGPRNVNGNKMRRRVVPGQDDRLGARAAAGLDDARSGRIALVVVQQIGQRLRLVGKADGFARRVTVDVGNGGHCFVATRSGKRGSRQPRRRGAACK